MRPASIVVLGVPPSVRPELWVTYSGATFDHPGVDAYRSILESHKVRRRSPVVERTGSAGVDDLQGAARADVRADVRADGPLVGSRTNGRPRWTISKRTCTDRSLSTRPTSPRLAWKRCGVCWSRTHGATPFWATVNP